MNQTLLLIALTAVAFVIGRIIRDLFRKRPITEKKARRRILNRLFAVIALILAVAISLTIAFVGGVLAYIGEIELVEMIILIIIMVFGVYLSISIVRYLKRE